MKRLQWAWVILLLAGCSSRETLVVYSPHGAEVLGDWKARFEAAYPEVDVQVMDMGSQEVYTKVKAESTRPVADVWWGAPSTMFMQAAKEGLLQPYRPTWADKIDAQYKDPQDMWYGTYRSPLAIVFNDRKLTPETAPKTWDELLDPKWKGKITIRKPLASGTMRTFIGAMISRAPNEDAGIAWLLKLHEATEAYPESPQLLYDHLKRNEDLVTVWLMADAALQRKRNSYPFGWVVPPQTPVLTEGIAIIKGAPHPELAQRFYEFVTTPEALAQQAEAYAKIPARNDIDPKLLPKWIVETKIDPMPIDWGHFAEKEAAWCKRWDDEVYNHK